MPTVRELSTEYLHDFLSLLFPHLCAACAEPLGKGEETICLFCRYDLPQTDLHMKRENILEKLFWGRVSIDRAAAFYSFHEKSKVQQLLHKLKYGGRSELGNAIGRMYGEVLADSGFCDDIDLIVPVPLHERRKRQRGYNQSDHFAMGLSEALEIPWTDEALKRKIYSRTQTGKNKYDRWSNVGEIFKTAAAVAHKHILLVDDVITTGATIEACAQTLLNNEGVKVSIAAIAMAR